MIRSSQWHINNQVDPNISLQWTDRSIDRPINRFSRVMWITQMCVIILRRVHHNIDFPVKRSVNWILHVLSSKNHRSLADWPLGSTRNMFTIYGIVATVSVGFFSSNLCTMYWIRSRKINSKLWNSMLWTPIWNSSFEYELKFYK